MDGKRIRATLARLVWPAAGLAVVGVTVAAATGLGQDDPPGTAVTEVALPLPADAPEPGPPQDGEGVPAIRPNLTTLTGVVEVCGRDHCVNGIVVDFGPPWHPGAVDLDMDGAAEVLTDEFDGLIGHSVDLTVEYGRNGEAEVFAVDGAFFRNEIGPPPWAGISGSR